MSARDSTDATVSLRSPAHSVLVLASGAAEALRALSDTIELRGRTAPGAPELLVTDGDRRGMDTTSVGADTPVFAYSPRNFLELADAFMALGVLSGEEGRGIKLAAQATSAVKHIRTIIDRLPSASFPRVFIQEEERPLATCGASSFLHALVSEAGGKDLFADRKDERIVVDREEVASREPDVILVAQETAVSERWSDTPAGRSGKVFALDLSAGVSPGPRSATLLVKVARLLHPDLIP